MTTYVYVYHNFYYTTFANIFNLYCEIGTALSNWFSLLENGKGYASQTYKSALKGIPRGTHVTSPSILIITDNMSSPSSKPIHTHLNKHTHISPHWWGWKGKSGSRKKILFILSRSFESKVSAVVSCVIYRCISIGVKLQQAWVFEWNLIVKWRRENKYLYIFFTCGLFRRYFQLSIAIWLYRNAFKMSEHRHRYLRKKYIKKK